MVAMVFENLTLFEVSLDGAQIGPRSIGRPAEVDEPVVEASPAGGARRIMALFVLGAIAGLAVLYRRSKRHDVAAGTADEAELAAAR